MTLLFLAVFGLSLVLSFATTRQVRDLAMRRSWVALPQSPRHVHENPLPRLGGVAIFLAFSFSLGLCLLLGVLRPRMLGGFATLTLFRIYVPACLIFAVGLYDDMRGVGPYVKFIAQGIAASMLFFSGMRISDLPLFGAHSLPWFLGLPLTVLWVAAITNAFNLIDGLDGLAAGSALFSTLVVFVVSIVNHAWMGSMMSLVLAGAILGFLRFNFNPATIFLGDSGSLFIGFLLSALALANAQKAPTLVAVAIPVVSFGLPILETMLSILRRLISGTPIFTADREHIHHKLLELGMSHRQVVIVLYAVSALFAMLSLFLLWPTGSTLGLVLAVVGTGVWLGVQRLNYLEFGELRRVAQRTIEQRQIVINNLSVRRAVQELKLAGDMEHVRKILMAAFDSNDFDGFELNIKAYPGENDIAEDRNFQWSKFARTVSLAGLPSWKLTLDLVTTSNRRRGSLVIHRMYNHRDLQLDINLVTSEFPIALADALERTLRAPEILPAAAHADGSFLAANV